MFILLLFILEADVNILKEIFQDTDITEIRRLRVILGLSVDKVVNILLNRSSGNNKRSSQLLLSDLATQVIDFDNDITITTNRSCIWNKAHCWYKAAQVNPSRLKMNLMVEFAG